MSPEDRSEQKSLVEERIKRNSELSPDEKANNPWVLYAGALQRRSEIHARK